MNAHAEGRGVPSKISRAQQPRTSQSKGLPHSTTRDKTYRCLATVAAAFTTAGFVSIAIRASIAHPNSLTITASCLLCLSAGAWSAWVTS